MYLVITSTLKRTLLCTGTGGKGLTHQRLCLVKIWGYADKGVLCLRNYFTRSDTKVIGTVV